MTNIINRGTALLKSLRNYSHIRPVFFSLVYLTVFSLSGTDYPYLHLDRSWEAVLEYAASHGFLHGRDILFTYGPFGYLAAGCSQGLFVWQRVLFAFAWSGVIAWAVVALARRLSGSTRYLFVGWFLFFASDGFMEQRVFLVMAFGCLVLTEDVKRQKGLTATVLVTFAALALIKFTFFVAALVSILCCFTLLSARGDVRPAIALAAFFSSFFLAFWLAAGQELANLWPWIRGSLEVAGGYSEAMVVVPNPWVLCICLVATVLFLGTLVMCALSKGASFNRAVFLMLLTFYVFLAWKQGFVRAGRHSLTFVFLLPLFHALLSATTVREAISHTARRAVAGIYIAVIMLCSLAAEIQDHGIMVKRFASWPERVRDNSTQLVKIVTGNWRNCFDALTSTSRDVDQPDLPAARALIGGATVDVLNSLQWAALYNHLNYHPRPVIQSYSAYTPYLQALNLAFFRSSRRPEFLLLDIETIDGRFNAQDDATALPYILTNYELVTQEGGFLVLRSKGGLQDLSLELLREFPVSFDQMLDLSPWNDSLLILQVEIRPTWFGRVMKALYQAPIFSLNTLSDSGEMTSRKRFIPTMGKGGFIINPLLYGNEDITAYYSGAGRRVGRVSFSSFAFTGGLVEESITLRLFRVR